MLNRNKPYGEVIGSGIAYKYEQNGKTYNAGGYEVDNRGNLLEDKPVAKDPVSQEPVREFLKDSPNIDLDDLTSNEVREMLDKFGVKYKVRDDKPTLLHLLREEILERQLDEA